MGILEPPSRGGASRFSSSSTKSSFTKRASLLTLTFQNSALILVMHYSRIMPSTSDHRYFTSTAVFLNELVKLGISLTLCVYDTSKTLAPNTPATVLFEQIYRNVFAGDGWKLAILAGGYTLQNLLQYVAVGNLDAVHFQVLYQLKILITAIFSVTLLRRHLGTTRWISLLVLTMGVIIVCLPAEPSEGIFFLRDTTDSFFARSLHELGQASPELFTPQSPPAEHLNKRSATYAGITEDLDLPEPEMNYSAGVTAVLIAAAVSGLTGVYFEKLLKESPSQATVWVRNVQMSMYSLVAALFGGVIYQDGKGIREHGFFEGYNWVVWTAVVLQAVGGIVASLVIREADNIVKNFATSISIVISFLISMMIFEFTVTWTFLLGTSFVMLSTYLYSVPDRHHHIHRPKPIRIVSLEKAAISPAQTPRLLSTPRAIDPTRLHLDPFNGEGGLTSSRPASPMLPRIPSRSDVRRMS